MPKNAKENKESGKDFWQRLNNLIGEERPFSWAKRVGIPKSTFSSCFERKCIFSGENLKKISEKTGWSIDWLLTGKSEGFGPLDKDAEEILANYFVLSQSSRSMVKDIIRRIAEEEKGREK